MKILFLFTGGTIGSTLRGDAFKIDERKPYLLLHAYDRLFGIDFSYDTAEPYTILSENNTGKTLSDLMKSVEKGLGSDYDGIVITHGTDTLQYSAAALSYAFSDAKCPICLVSSNTPIEEPASNGLSNLRGALRFIREVKCPGVWVPYQNPGELLKIHRGTRLLGGAAFSDRIDSIKDSFYGSFREGVPFEKNPQYRENADGMPALGAVDLPTECKEILMLSPFPSMTYPTLDDGVRYILHASYHSGTVNTEAPTVDAFFKEASERGILSFLTGAVPGVTYESSKKLHELGIRPLYNIAPISAYMKLFMWHTLHNEIPATEAMLTPLAGDILP